MSNTVTTQRLAWQRVVPGYYTATYGEHEFTITHREFYEDDGYGRRNDWILAHTGPTYQIIGYEKDAGSDPVERLWHAKEDAEAYLQAILDDREDNR